MGSDNSKARDRQWDSEKQEIVQKNFAEYGANPNLIYFKKIKFPEINPIQYNPVRSSADLKAMIRIQNYRWPSVIPSDEKGYQGIVFFLHDFTDYVGRHTFTARQYADLGYDFYGMDMRGHGASEGVPAFQDSVQILVEDFTNYMIKILNTFYCNNQEELEIPPIYLVGQGQGAMIALHFLLNNEKTLKNGEQLQQLVSSVAFLNPFFKWKDPTAMAISVTKIRCIQKMLQLQKNSTQEFNKRYTPEQKTNAATIPRHELHWVFDIENPIQNRIYPFQTIISFQEEIDDLSATIDEAVKNADANQFFILQQPIIFFIDDDDTNVNNDFTEQIISKLPREVGHQRILQRNQGQNLLRNAKTAKETINQTVNFFQKFKVQEKLPEQTKLAQKQETEERKTNETAATDDQKEQDLFDLVGF